VGEKNNEINTDVDKQKQQHFTNEEHQNNTYQQDNTDVDQQNNTDVDQQNNTDQEDHQRNTDVDQRDNTGVDQQNDQQNSIEDQQDHYENYTNMSHLNDLDERNNSNDASQGQTVDVYSLTKEVKSNCNVNMIDTDLVGRSFSIDEGATSDLGRMFCGSPEIVLCADEVFADLLVWDTTALSNVSTDMPSGEAVLNNLRFSQRIAKKTTTKLTRRLGIQKQTPI